MASEIDSKIFQRTRDTIGKVIKKPPLQDKFLSRPPFRYLRDIILEVLRTTTFFKGLYSGKELDTKGEWDRDAKTSFLQKAIDVVVFTTGNPVKARPSKIVAGLEVNRTNEFLQMIGIAILKKLDSSEAIRKVLNGERPTPPSDKKKTKIDTEKKKESVTDHEKKEEPETKTTEEEVENTNEQQATPPPPPQERPQHRPGTRGKGRNIPVSKKSKDEDPLSSGSGSQVQLSERPISAKGKRKMSMGIDDQDQSPPDDKDTGIEETSQVFNEGNIHHSPSPPPIVPNGLVPKSLRPSSSRPPAPRVVKRVTDTEDNNSRVSSGHDHVLPNVILDKTQDEQDDEEEFIIQDSSPPLPSNGGLISNEDPSTVKPEGALTKALMAAKERFIGEDEDVRSVTIDEAQRKRERVVVEKEVGKLQGSIQSLCQSANPLGKIMDYVQEDLDSMYQELEMWRKENSKHTEELRREERITDDELTPLYSQLTELDAKIDEQMDLISAAKCDVLSNEQKINKLVLSIYSNTH